LSLVGRLRQAFGGVRVAAGVIEVEAKVRVEDLKNIEGRLREAGARRLGADQQVDTFFRHPSRDFGATDETLRLRRYRGRMELTYKGPRAEGAIKKRTERTVALRHDPSQLLEDLGFEPIHTVKKHRSLWRMGDVEVALDKIPGLGTFVEVEATRGGEKAVQQALRRLGISERIIEPRSYFEMTVTPGKTKPRRAP
jgi:adenylate cyclase class 2